MTADQEAARLERLAILIYDGGLTEEEAHQCCNFYPEYYGLYQPETKQEVLF